MNLVRSAVGKPNKVKKECLKLVYNNSLFKKFQYAFFSFTSSFNCKHKSNAETAKATLAPYVKKNLLEHN